MELIIRESQYRRLFEGVNTNDVLNKTWISYGTMKYDPYRFKGVERNNMWSQLVNKPKGGLWASPIDSGNGWVDFASNPESSFRKNLKQHFMFKLKPDAKIYVIDSFEDLKAISTLNDNNAFGNQFGINTEELLDSGYDGIYVTEEAAGSLRQVNFPYKGLDSWDVESICIFNKNVIEPIREDRFDRLQIDLDNDEKLDKIPWWIESGAMDGYDKAIGDWLKYKRKNQAEREEKVDKRYGNRNIEDEAAFSPRFHGKHPAIAAQGDEDDIDTQRARKYNGTLMSALK